MALGARPGDIARWVLSRGSWPLIAGLGSGLAAVLACSRLLRGLLYDVQATEPAILASGVAFVALVASLGALAPARRAARSDPATVLRSDLDSPDRVGIS